MNILVVGNYREGSGWSRACIDMILSLDAAGANMFCRNLPILGKQVEIPARISELESKSIPKLDAVVQSTLPHLYSYEGRAGLNVARYFTETSHFRASGWADNINMMDLALVSCQQGYQASRDSGVRIPIEVVPCATDVVQYQQNYAEPPQLEPFAGFTFYAIGEWVRRKNFFGLLQAYFLEFSVNEPVRLVLKVNHSGFSPDRLREELQKSLNGITNGMKLHGKAQNYPALQVIAERLTDDEMRGLHCSSDCFVLPSYGEGMCYPAIDAMGFGKTPIVTGCTAFQDYITNTTGWLVDTHSVPVFGETETFESLFVGDEHWSLVNINSLRCAMREAYENTHLREEKASNGIEAVYGLSYETIGQKTLSILESALH